MQLEFCQKTYDIKIWNGESLGEVIAIDTETDFVPFTETPDIITFQATDGNSIYYVPIDQIDAFFKINDRANTRFIFQNFAFDKDVIEKCAEFRFFDAIEAGKVWDTKIMYQLQHLATEGWVPFKSSLKELALIYLGEELDKNEDVRHTFGEFKNQAIEDIPEEHIVYAAKDAVATYLVYLRLAVQLNNLDSNTYLSHHIQLKGSLALNRLYKNGIGFDLNKAQEKLAGIDKELELEANKLALYGWVRGQKGIKEKYEWITTSFLGLDLPKTESGEVSSKAEDLLKYKDNPFVESYLKYHELEKLGSFVREIDKNIVHPSYTNILKTGRTSCSKPNFQQLPRQGGIRELFVGNFIITDYSYVELCTLAQVCYLMFGSSGLRDTINAGIDPHTQYASIVLSKSMEEVTRDERQKAKACNFGFPGGMGIPSFLEYAEKTYGVTFTYDEAKHYKDLWFKNDPVMKEYMKNEAGVAVTLTGRVRGKTTYCAEKNTPFQGLAADGAKLALWRLMNNDLFTLRGFVHDEIITEVPEGLENELLSLQEKIMVEEMQRVCPDVKIRVESQTSRCYTK